MQVLDDMAESVLIGRNRTWSQPTSPAPMPSGRRWFAIATCYGQAFLAEGEIAADGWPVFHPLCIGRAGKIEPLFPGYLFAAFDPADEDWPRICSRRGVWRILGDLGKPSAIPIGAVEDLIARTSPRRIVDDPGSAPFPNPQPQRAHWQNITSLSADARNALLLRLFGRT